MSAFQSRVKNTLAGHGRYGRHRRLAVIFGFLGTVDLDGVELRGVKHILFPFDRWGLARGGYRSFSLGHLAAAFEHRALFDHQRRRLYVSGEFRGPAQLDSITGNDVPGYDSMNCGDGYLNVRINLASGTNNQVATRRSDATRKASVHAQHSFKRCLAGDDCAA